MSSAVKEIYWAPNETERHLPWHEMIFVPGGSFMMGDDEGPYDREKPAHKVKLTGFFIGKYPVTQALWEALMGNNPSRFQGNVSGRRPVEQVSWKDAQEFIKALNERTGRAYRLPTEAEWEYAARGGPLKEHYLYAGSDKLKEVGWYDENSHGETKPVGLKCPNGLGLYDMSGNVYEWCQDWYSNSYYQACADKGIVENPAGPVEGDARVLRGGLWLDFARDCRVALRNYGWPINRSSYVGFRLALALLSGG